MTLTEFLLARIAEDEAEWHAINDEPPGSVYDYAQVSIHSIEGRVLAECEAKRNIIELHTVLSWTEPARSLVREMPRCASCADNELADYDGAPLVDWPCPTLRLLAAVYADHPDYDTSWRP